MAKKKKEVCPYCQKSFAYLSRHKCKIKERIEGSEDDKSEVERRHERIEEKKREFTRNLRKDEQVVLNTINRERDLYFDDLLKLTNKKRNDLDNILETLSLQSKIKVNRELVTASWTKHIYSIENYDDKISSEDIKVNKKRKDFIWNIFNRQPCFLCPVISKCREDNIGEPNPRFCRFITAWIEISLEGKEYNINFEDIQKEFDSEL